MDRELTVSKAALVMVGVGTIALMGIPGIGRYDPPRGAHEGTVVTSDGEPLSGVSVGLFDAADQRLYEITTTDGEGRFAFQNAPPDFHVLARPEPETGFVGAWALDRECASPFDLELVVHPGRRVRVRVTDENDAPLSGVQIRAYDAGAMVTSGLPFPAMVVRTWSDARGQADFLCPKNVHLGALGNARGRGGAWRFNEEISEEETELQFTLPATDLIEGWTVDEFGRALPGVLVSAWDERSGWQWNGYRLTDADGFFSIPGTRSATPVLAGTLLRAVALDQTFLPTQRVVPKSDGGPIRLQLSRGRPFKVHCADGQGTGTPARVWIWSARHQVWSWGSRTDADGDLRASVGIQPAVYAHPLDVPSADGVWWSGGGEGEAGVELVVDDPELFR